jgi:dTDP-4-dehydrorhamnose reductase
MANKKIIVTGASGFVGGSVVYHGAQNHTIYALSRGECIYDHASVHWHTLEYDDQERLAEIFNTVQPDAVIHVAAIADIDYCENNQDEAYKVNVDYTCRLAQLCKKSDTRMVFVSTDNVYDGTQPVNTHTDPVSPVNYYGQTKVKAEQIVLDTVADTAIARLALVMGFPIIGGGNSFLMRMITQWEAGDSVGVPDNEVRSPIDLITAGLALIEMANNTSQGVVLLAGLDAGSRIELVKQLAIGFGYDPEQVHPFYPSQLRGRGERPETVICDTSHTREVLETPMLNIEMAIPLMQPFQP